MKKIGLVIFGLVALFFGACFLLARDSYATPPADPLISCLAEAKERAANPEKYDYYLPDCALKDVSDFELAGEYFKKKDSGMTIWLEYAGVKPYFYDWREIRDIASEQKKYSRFYTEQWKDYVTQFSYNKASREDKTAGIGDLSNLILRKEWGDVIHIGTGANDMEFTEGKDPIWILRRGDVNLVVYTGYCEIEVRGRVFHDMSNDYYSSDSDFWRAHHVYRDENDVYRIINEGDTEHTYETILNSVLRVATKVTEGISEVCGSQGKKGAVDTKPEEKKEEVGTIETVDPVKAITDWIVENLGETDFERLEKEQRDYELYGRTPEMTREIINQAQREWAELTGGGKVSGELPAVTKVTPESPDVPGPKMVNSVTRQIEDLLNQEITPGSTILSGGNTTMFITPNGSVVSIEKQGKLTVIDVQRKTPDATGSTNLYYLIEGEIEINTNGERVEIRTPNAIVRQKGTHYKVSYDPAKRETAVVVYEGEVEVTSKSRTETIMPRDGGPGVLVVRSRLSWPKVTIAALVIAAVCGAAAVILRKKPKKKK